MSSAGRRLEGNALYIQGKLEEAIEKYVEAITMDDKDPAPLRTLSSANFELGDYDKCLETIVDALKLEKDHTKVMGLRLREAKCHFYKRQFSKAEDILLEHCNLEDIEVQQLYKAVEEYMRFPRDEAGWEEVLRIPRIRPNLTPHLTTFFTRGHDDPVAPFSDKDLALLAAKGPLSLDIFYGGIGDGRHLFQQLNHIYAYGKKLSISAPDKLALMRGSFSFVLQDIKPEVMARLLVILCLLYQTSDAMRIGDDREQRFLEMVIVYIYACDIMPPYCETHMMGVIRDLIQSANTGNNFGIPWLSVDEESKEKICEVLSFWLEDHSDLPGIDFDVESAQGWYINKLTDDALAEVKKLGPEALEELRQFQTTRMLFPLQELINEREPVLAKLISKKPLNLSKIALYGKKTWRMNVTLLQGPGYLKFIDKVYGEAIAQRSRNIGDYVQEIWHEATDQLPTKLLRTRTKMDWVLPRNETKFSLLQFIMPWFAPCARIFRNEWFDSKVLLRVEDATLHLDKIRFGKEKTTFDAIYLSNIPDYIGGHLATILYALPNLKKATNIEGVSSYAQTNIQMNTMAFMNGYIDTTAEYLALPDLQAADEYTGLNIVLTEKVRKMRREIQQGHMPMWVLLSEPHRWALHNPSKRPERPNAIRWLYRMFFKLALPVPRKGPQEWKMSPMNRFEQPLTLSTFFRLCIYLVETLDYPAHWASSVLDLMLQSGRASTTARPPTTAPMSLAEASLLSQSTAGVYDIRPFLPELRALAIQFRPVLPFPLTSEIPSHAYLRKYSVRLHCHPTTIGTQGNLLTLVLFHPNKKSSLRQKKWLWQQIVNQNFNGAVDPEMAIISCFNWSLNTEAPVSSSLLNFKGPLYEGTAEWVMEEGEIEKMKKWGWAIGMIRTDNWTLFTNMVMMSDGVVESGMEY